MSEQKYDYIIIEKKCGSLEHISDFIQERSLASRLNFKKTWELMLVIDEICSSIIMNSSNKESELKLIWKNNASFVEIEILDQEEEFNPLIPPDEEKDCSELGAMGAYLINRMVEKACYKRVNGLNKTIITKNKCKKNNNKNSHH
ncbi:MAG TPA: ATP-binding protein [bacterium]|nr:ATP-binding protein [bacterium]